MSYLSEKVQYQIINIGENFYKNDYQHFDRQCYVDSNNVIKWNLIEPMFEDCFGKKFNKLGYICFNIIVINLKYR